MRTNKLVSSCLLIISWAMVASSRNLLPSDEDLFADMLVMVNHSKVERHVDTRSVEEGSGYGDIIPIHPLSSMKMERMEQAPADEYNNVAQSEMEHKEEGSDLSNNESMHTEHQEDEKVPKQLDYEGSGDNEKGVEEIDMVILKDGDEEINLNSEVETVLDHTEKSHEELVEESDTSPIPDEPIRVENVENAELVRETESDPKVEGNKAENTEVEVEVEKNLETHENIEVEEKENLDTHENIKAEEKNFEVQAVSTESVASILPIENVENTTVQEQEEIIVPLEHSTESNSPVIDDSKDMEVTTTVETPEAELESTTKYFIEEPSEPSVIIVPSIAASEEVLQKESSTETSSEIPTTTPVLQTASEEMTTVKVEITSPEYVTESTTEHVISSSPVPIIILSPSIVPSEEEQTEISILTNDPESESVDITTPTESTISASLEPSPENEPVMLKTSAQIPQGENNNSEAVQEGSIYKSLSLYVIAGILAIILIVLVIAFTMRYRHRRHRMRPDNRSEKDAENGILGNGKYQEDSDENNIKNNEITPLVIKNSSQINKFEKSPNFSSQKNINTAVNDKNIEKDNVLKSNQTIIEDEDDAKKRIDDEVDEEKKKSLEDTKQVTPEKVVVHTRVDLDSIPKKPVIINRNGHSYHAVPGGETET